jgi:hypothetical protein
LQDFLSDKQAISFFIHLKYFRDGPNVQAVNLDNEKTGEKFMVKKDGLKMLEIGKYEEYYEYRNIKIDFSL